MTARDWLIYLLLCSMLGACGQLARTVAGFKKLHDSKLIAGKAPAPSENPDQKAGAAGSDDGIQVTRLISSLVLGAVAGVIAGLYLHEPNDPNGMIDAKFLLALMASGYAGSDFIEANIGKAISGR